MAAFQFRGQHSFIKEFENVVASVVSMSVRMSLKLSINFLSLGPAFLSVSGDPCCSNCSAVDVEFIPRLPL